MKPIRIALLDMNNNHKNQGMRNIEELSYAFKNNAKEKISIDKFDVRFRDEMPNIQDYDIFISSGGPGNPHIMGHSWEQRYFDFLDQILEHNTHSAEKKFLFLVCHSFQLACIHWQLGNVCERKSYSFGVMPIHKTQDGEAEYLLKNLPDPFYAVDSRAYQFIEPDLERIEKLGMKIIALEKVRPTVHLERAVMAMRFSDEIFGTQFHPEADPHGMLENLKDYKNREAMIENFGVEKYLETVDRINDADKIVLTQKEILPRFLERAAQQIQSALVFA